MGHDPGMSSRVNPKYKTKYRVSNWAEYDKALVQRGDITLWISEEAIESWKPAPTGLRGAQRKFSDHAIETALGRWCMNRRVDSVNHPVLDYPMAEWATFSA